MMKQMILLSLSLLWLLPTISIADSTDPLPFYEAFKTDQNVCIVFGNVLLDRRFLIERIGQAGIETLSTETLFDGKPSELEPYPDTENLFVIADSCVPSGSYQYQIKGEGNSGWTLYFDESVEIEETQSECDEENNDQNPCLDQVDPENYDLWESEENEDDDDDDEGCGCSVGDSCPLPWMILIGILAWVWVLAKERRDRHLS